MCIKIGAFTSKITSGGKITVVKIHNIVAHKLCINTIIDTKTGKAVKKKTRNSYILHKNLFFEIIAKKGALNL